MNLFLKFAVVVVLVGLFISGLLSVLSELLSRISPHPPPRLRDPNDEDDYDEHEMLGVGRERDRVARL
jgi:hypothetical protein